VFSLDIPFQYLSCTQNVDSMQNLCPREVDVSTTPSGPSNLLVFHLLGLGFWILFMLKRPLEPYFKNHILANKCKNHISSQEISYHHSIEFIHSVFL
jgi:hypothetical protein